MDRINTPVLITGCQRSGTTLLNLILDSHPDVVGIDEAFFKRDLFHQHMQDSRFTHVAFKLPTIAPNIPSFKPIPGIKILWMVRDPRDVVLSMLTLNLGQDVLGNKPVCWANHSQGAEREIIQCLDTLQKNSGVDQEILQKFSRICEVSQYKRRREDAVFLGTLSWTLKQALLPLYTYEELDFLVVHYESLVIKPDETLKNITDFIHLKWHENLLNHHRLHEGVSIGNTINTRPIDSGNTRKWEGNFTPEELSSIHEICHTHAHQHGYEL